MLPLTMRLEVFSLWFYLGVFPCKVSVHLKFWMNLILFSCVVPSKDEIKPIVSSTNKKKEIKKKKKQLVSAKQK